MVRLPCELMFRFLLFFALTLSALAVPRGPIVLIAGPYSHPPGDHEYEAGCYLLQSFLAQNGASSIVVTGGWPQDETVLDHARAVILFMDGGERHPLLVGNRLQKLSELARHGVGIATLHYAMELPSDRGGNELLDWVGGYYERPYSKNPQNDAHLVQANPQHPISRGWKTFDLRDEWYYRIRFTPGDKRVTPILTSELPPADPHQEIVAWATERADGGRAFGFTGLHLHKNWADPDYRRLLVNAVLWTAKKKVPKAGARCELAEGDLSKHLFPTVRPKR